MKNLPESEQRFIVVDHLIKSTFYQFKTAPLLTLNPEFFVGFLLIFNIPCFLSFLHNILNYLLNSSMQIVYFKFPFFVKIVWQVFLFKTFTLVFAAKFFILLSFHMENENNNMSGFLLVSKVPRKIYKHLCSKT